MSKSNTWEYGLLALVFNNVDFTGVGDAGGLLGSVTEGSLYVSLHTGDPSDEGDQDDNEVTYGSYARVAVARNSGAWTVSGTPPIKVNPTAAIVFPTSTSGTQTANFFGIGTAVSGAGKLLYSGPIVPVLDCSSGETPQLTTDTEITED